ncbi:MAG: acyl carrier protein [Betaproteobacteria bacterium]|nr:MAG: acyl carrier protein [Betaproteobacteria bacterium]
MSPSIDANRLLAVVAEVAREARPRFEAYVALDSSLERELGLDSLARVELVLRLEREFAASLPEKPRTARSQAWCRPKACAPPMPRERSPRRSNITPSASPSG